MSTMKTIFGLLLIPFLVVYVMANRPSTCLRGPPGLPGNNGVPGHNGGAGRDGRDGAKGDKGERGLRGPVGTGIKGEKGSPGLTKTENRNWKQCAWKKEDPRDIGLVRDCVFIKKYASTALRVVYQGNFYVKNCANCCKRWFITFNGAECSGPLPIDAAFWLPSNAATHHDPGSIEGYCENIHKGKIRVGINIGNCAGYGNADGITGWNSVSRLVIEEIPPSQ